MRYEGTISDGRPRFLESILSGDAKDVVFDAQRSALYPFGDYKLHRVTAPMNDRSRPNWSARTPGVTAQALAEAVMKTLRERGLLEHQDAWAGSPAGLPTANGGPTSPFAP